MKSEFYLFKKLSRPGLEAVDCHWPFAHGFARPTAEGLTAECPACTFGSGENKNQGVKNQF